MFGKKDTMSIDDLLVIIVKELIMGMSVSKCVDENKWMELMR